MTGRRLLASLAALLLALASCGGDEPERRAEGKREARGATEDRDGKRRGAKERGDKAGGARREGREKGADPEPDDGEPSEERSAERAEDASELATASAVVDEPEPDAKKEGITPDYPEILKATVQGLGDRVRFTLTFAGDIPDRMPSEQTYMLVTWSVTDEGDDSGYTFGAQASSKGWKPYAGGKGDAHRFPGTFTRRANRITMTLPWSYLGGPHPFEWFTSSSWFQYLAGQSNYVVDPVPNNEPARFPN